MIGFKELSEMYEYLPEDGTFVALAGANTRDYPPGSVRPPSLRKDGHYYMKIRGQRYKASHLAYLLMNCKPVPENMGLYYKDGDRSNLRWSNLSIKRIDSGDYTG